MLGCLGKYLESNVIVTHLDASFFTLCCSQIHTQLHTHVINYSLIKMPSLPSPETTMTLAGVGMVRFVIIPTLLSFSFSFSEESFFARRKKRFVFVDFARWIKNEFPQPTTNLFLSLSLSRKNHNYDRKCASFPLLSSNRFSRTYLSINDRKRKSSSRLYYFSRWSSESAPPPPEKERETKRV